MRVAVDIRSLAATQGRGVSHYTVSLVAELARAHPNDQWILVQTGRKAFTLPHALDLANVRLVRKRTSNKLLNLRMALTGRPRLDDLAGGADVVFTPNLGFIRVGNTPLVVTVHDLSFALFPGYFTSRERWWHRLIRPRQLLERASRVIAVSGQTRGEIAQLYGLVDKVRVVHSGIEPMAKPTRKQCEEVSKRLKLPKRYLLFVGASEPRKNIEGMLAAFAKAREQGLKSELVMAGPRSDARTWPDGVRALGYVAELDKPALYAGATALVLLSHHEGFGFPPLEALAVGTPSLVSDLPVFAETIDGAALRVKPDRPVESAKKLIQLEQDTAMRNKLLQKAPDILERLSWPAAAAATHAVLREAAGSRDA